MRGIDVIEALQDIDETLILRAKQHKKAAPPWIRYISLAALFCCALLLGLLVINRLITPGHENIPDTLAPTEEGTSNPVTESETFVTLSSTLYPVTLTIPEQYEEHVLVDTMFIDSSLYARYNLDITASFESVPFSFYSYFSEQSVAEGLAWLICVYRADEFNYDSYASELKGSTMILSHTLIASNDDYIYMLIHPGQPSDFYNKDSLEATESYLLDLQEGQMILQGFIAENNLIPDPDWSKIYQELTIDPVVARLAELKETTSTDLPSSEVPQNPAEPSSIPTADVMKYPAYVVTEKDLITTNGISMGMTPDQVTQIMGTPLERSTNIDGSTYLSYPEIYFSFGTCTRCGSEHLVAFGLHDACGLMPLGLDMDMPLEDVLTKFDAQDAEPTYASPIYRADETHYAMYTPLDGSGLVSITIYAGDYVYTLAFNRQNKVYICNVQFFQSADFLCPEN